MAAIALLGSIALALMIFDYSPADDLDDILREDGFVPNPGFSATFSPGDVIKVVERDSRMAERRLPRPLLVLRKEECFPGSKPTETAFSIPGRTGYRHGSLKLSGKELTRFLPALKVRGEGAKAYELRVGNPRVLTFAMGDLSERFSPSCVAWFDRAIAAGERPEWFETVIETVVSSELALTIKWEMGAAAEARTRLSESIRSSLPVAEATTGLDTREEQVLRSTGLMMLGYRSRPMEPVRESDSRSSL